MITPEKILLIQLRQLGDVLLTTPAARVLRRKFPSAHIAFLTEENAFHILSGNPDIDEIITIKRKQSLFQQLNVIKEIRGKKFDLIFDFLVNPRTTYISFLSGAKTRVTFHNPPRSLLYTDSAKASGNYAVQHKLSLLEHMGIEGGDVTPVIAIPEENMKKEDLFLESKGIGPDDFKVCIDASHRRPLRKWTAEGFAEVADRLNEEYKAKVIFLWGPGEKEEVSRIMARCRNSHHLAPELTLKDHAALISRADLLLGNCSYPRHVAAAVGTPSLVILGATGEEWTHPAPIHQVVKKGLSCQPCGGKSCDSNLACLNELTPDEIMAAFEKLRPHIGKLQDQ